jgi:hypothetical protein
LPFATCWVSPLTTLVLPLYWLRFTRFHGT